MRHDRAFARAAAAEVAPGDQDRRAAIARLVQDEVRVLGCRPCCSGWPRTPSGRDRLWPATPAAGCGMITSVSTFSRGSGAATPVEHGEGFHGVLPVRPDGAGRRCCRRSPPRPPSPGWRGGCARRAPGGRRNCGSRSKRSAGPAPPRSPLAATHCEQPGSRQSKPAARNIRSSPSASAACMTLSDPGTTQARHARVDTRGRGRSPPPARRSSMRLLVQEPMKTRSIGVPAIGFRGSSPM